MDLPEYVRSESSAFAERLLSALEAQRQQLRDELSAEMVGARTQAETLRADLEQQVARVSALEADLERETARAAALETDLESVIEAHRAVDAERARLEADFESAIEAHREVDSMRGRLEEELRGTRELVQSARAEAERLSEALERENAQHALLDGDLASEREARERVEQDAQRLAAEADALREQLDALREQLDALRAQEETLRAQGEAFREQGEVFREQAAAHQRDAAASAQSAAASAQLLEASVAAMDALSQAASVDALFQTLAEQVSAHVPRVAIFRAKGHHFEGDRGVGIDDGVSLAKLMIPAGVDSLVARAVTARTLVRADREQLATAAPPLGGTAAAALAVPLVIDDQPFAVLYADSTGEIGGGQATVTLLLARHAVAVLARLAREFTAMEELREYAAMLVGEAAQIFHADVESGCPASERLRRLRDAIDYARELYAHRAALEGRSAASLFNDHLAALGEQDPLFGQALAEALDQRETQRTAS